MYLREIDRSGGDPGPGCAYHALPNHAKGVSTNWGLMLDTPAATSKLCKRCHHTWAPCARCHMAKHPRGAEKNIAKSGLRTPSWTRRFRKRVRGITNMKSQPCGTPGRANQTQRPVLVLILFSLKRLGDKSDLQQTNF